MLDLLTRLVTRSLVVVQREAAGTPRYRFLESVWRFALEKLAWFLTWNGTSGVAEAPAPSAPLTVGAPRPNPSSAGVLIPFELREASELEVLIVDSQGRRVRGIQPASYAPGRAELTWDGRSDRGEAVGAGVYFVRVGTSDGRVSRVVRVVRAN